MARSKSRNKKKTSRRKGSGGGFLGREQQLEILAVGLLALALFTLLSLVPLSALGERAGELFPSGNTMGVVGAAVRLGLTSARGAAAFLVPVLLALVGLRAGGWMDEVWTVRLAGRPPHRWIIRHSANPSCGQYPKNFTLF